jgi:hypothetical protein
MGQNRGGGKVMLWPIEFHCAGFWFQLESIMYTYVSKGKDRTITYLYSHRGEVEI